jgi:hypothetical protein
MTVGRLAGVTVTVVGATLIAVDAGGSDNGVHVIVGVGVNGWP